jgi:hypothetical protein
VLEQVLDDEVLLLPRGATDVVHLNATATSVWRLLEVPATADDVAAALALHYGLDLETVRGTVLPLVDELVERAVLEPDV